MEELRSRIGPNCKDELPDLHAGKVPITKADVPTINGMATVKSLHASAGGSYSAQRSTDPSALPSPASRWRCGGDYEHWKDAGNAREWKTVFGE